LVIVTLASFAVLTLIVTGLGVKSRWEVRLILGALAIPGVLASSLPELLRPHSNGRRRRQRTRPWSRESAGGNQQS
jgi:hypothetical protein